VVTIKASKATNKCNLFCIPFKKLINNTGKYSLNIDFECKYKQKNRYKCYICIKNDVL